MFLGDFPGRDNFFLSYFEGWFNPSHAIIYHYGQKTRFPGVSTRTWRQWIQPWYLVYTLLGAITAGLIPVLLQLIASQGGSAAQVGLGWGGMVKHLITHCHPYTDFNAVLHQHTPDEIKSVIEWNK